MDYKISSRDYLKRARQCLGEASLCFLFYAAFELRCGIEARMQEYLEAQKHLPKGQKSEWKIAKLGKNIEKAFRTGDRIVEITILKEENKAPLKLYYTPVTSKLRKMGEKLGDLLHVMKIHHPIEKPFWQQTQKFLESVYEELKIANTGTLLGPPLFNSATGQMYMNEELDNAEQIYGKIQIGDLLQMKVDYHDSFPT